MSVITSAGALGAPAGGSAPVPPSGSGSVALTPARPTGRHKLAVKILIKWSWNHRRTRLVRITVGRLPARATLSITCRGRGCPSHTLRVTSRTLRRRHRTLRAGKVYRAGDRLLVSLSAPSWRPERARIMIRNGRLPAMELL
jgi:hypothetical protein